MSASKPTRSRPSSPAAPHALLRSKLLCLVVLAAAVMANLRSPHHLDTEAGDRRGDRYMGTNLQWALLVQACIVLAAAAAYCALPSSPARMPWTAGEAAAAAACLAGCALRAWCFRTLGPLFTYVVGIRAGHQLVGTGPYALLLHPSYTGGALLGLGFCGYVGALRWRSTALLVTANIALLIGMRIHNEEAVLAEHFGEAWRRHAAMRWRLIPFVF